jgi:hypothetical protein
MKKLAGIALFLFALSAHAALPPAAESLRRIRAISESKEVFDAIGVAEWVKSITENEDGSYSVSTEKCVLKVTVTPLQTDPPSMVPPLRAQVGQLQCLAPPSSG